MYNPVGVWELGSKRFCGAGGASDCIGTGGLLVGVEATSVSRPLSSTLAGTCEDQRVLSTSGQPMKSVLNGLVRFRSDDILPVTKESVINTKGYGISD
jgi:hypothetical protein